jgi:acetyl-CoA carboxylase carboxyl transferase subunit beta
MIAFSGPRVIEQTIRQKLPEGFQRSEFLKDRGVIDMVVDRRKMHETIGKLLSHLMSHKTENADGLPPVNPPSVDVA